MNGRNKENLRQLFEKFLNSEQAREAMDNVQKARQIFREYPAPKPDKELIADIKVKIARALLRRKVNAFRRIAYKTAAVAAALILITAISVKLFEKSNGKPGKIAATSTMPEIIWESDNTAAEDADLATLTAEVEQVESEILALQLGENNGNGYGAVTELEMELIEINSDFWKG